MPKTCSTSDKPQLALRDKSYAATCARTTAVITRPAPTVGHVDSAVIDATPMAVMLVVAPESESLTSST